MNISQAQEDYFRENTGTATLERDYEESTELIKSIDIDNDYDYEDEDIH
jgi:hypothetical protein